MIRVKISSFKKHKQLYKIVKKSSYSHRKLKEKTIKALRHSYKSRKKRSTIYRSYWIYHINNYLKTISLTYNDLIFQLKKNHVLLNRKMIFQQSIINPLQTLAFFFVLFYK